MRTFYFLLLLLLYSVDLNTRDAGVVCYAVRVNTRIAIRGARDNTRIATRGVREIIRSSTRGTGENARIVIRRARDNSRSSIRSARDNPKSSIGGARDIDNLQGSTLDQLRVRIGCIVFTKHEFETSILVYNKPWPTNFFIPSQLYSISLLRCRTLIFFWVTFANSKLLGPMILHFSFRGNAIFSLTCTSLSYPPSVTMPLSTTISFFINHLLCHLPWSLEAQTQKVFPLMLLICSYRFDLCFVPPRGI